MATLVHTEQYHCTTTASCSWRMLGFHPCLQCRDYLQQALVYFGSICFAQTACVTGLQISNALHVFCVLHWVVRPSPSTTACRRLWSSSHWSHRTVLCACLKKTSFQAWLPKGPPCPNFLLSRKQICTIHLWISRLSLITVENTLHGNVIWKHYKTCRLFVLITNFLAKYLKGDQDGFTYRRCVYFWVLKGCRSAPASINWYHCFQVLLIMFFPASS